ncbi:MAG: hypothetical protein WBA05_18425 [Gordonia sp. (in: high G+C Gram-positive bacteria)]|uniref:hypothetical protein n=1 Tax=Gordonia TaxID=2053 RepID=UPI0032659CF0
MTHRAGSPTDSGDRRLALAIAALMRTCTIIAAALLVAGAAVAYLLPGLIATVLLAAGCALLILLPVLRLAMMAGYFVRRGETAFVVVTVIVIGLVIAGGAMGLLI